MKSFAIATMAAVVMITLAANFGWGQRAFALLHFVPGRDTTGHFVLFGLLGFSLVSWLSRPAPAGPGWPVARLTVLLMTLIIVEELGQAFIPKRTFSLLDLSASLIGLAVGSLASQCFLHSRAARRAD